jgi:hypothetical protein
MRLVRACAEADRPAILRHSRSLGFLTGEEGQAMLDAQANAAIMVGLPFSEGRQPFDFSKQASTSTFLFEGLPLIFGPRQGGHRSRVGSTRSGSTLASMARVASRSTTHHDALYRPLPFPAGSRLLHPPLASGLTTHHNAFYRSSPPPPPARLLHPPPSPDHIVKATSLSTRSTLAPSPHHISRREWLRLLKSTAHLLSRRLSHSPLPPACGAKNCPPLPFPNPHIALSPLSPLQEISRRIGKDVQTMIRERLTPPRKEIYSLHRRLNGCFQLASRVGARIRAREILLDFERRHEFSTEDGEGAETAAAGQRAV